MAVPTPAAQAVETLYTKVVSIRAADWSVTKLEILLDLHGKVPAADVLIASIELPAAALSLADTRVRCGRLHFDATEFACLDARFSIDLPETGRRDFPGEAHYDRRSGAVSFELRGVPLAGGKLGIRGTVSEAATAISFSGEALALGDLAAIGGAFGLPVAGIEASGTVDLSGEIGTRDGEVVHASGRATLHQASVSNEAGTVVAASADGRIGLEARRASGQPAGWEFAAELAADAGETYVEPVYANLSENPVTLTAAGRIDDALAALGLERYSLRLGSQVEAAGAMRIVLPQSEDDTIAVSGSVELVDASFETLYTSLFQVFAAGTLAGDLETDGSVSGRLTFEDNAVASAELTLHDLTADDRQGRLGVYGLDGVIRWPGPAGEPGDAGPSNLRWQGARVYDIPLGAARIDVLLGGNDVELTQPLRIPTMGGALRINRMAMRNYGEPDASGVLDAELEPIQLGLLTGAFGWPAFSGTLSGRLPSLTYDGNAMTVGGALTARAFDGDVEFANLRLEQPFGRVPRLYGDLRLRRLDLEQVTDTFSFGLIQGRLSGDVTNLQMFDWQPVAMDLHLYTPPDDKSRRRISQRAVENLASVGGGGAAAALSSGFMSFFDVFSYRKIGLRCILADGVCRMSGAGPAGKNQFGQGYYIVQGSGLPRIDVVGYRHEVSWPRLVRQLEQITQSGAPTVN